MSKYTDNWFIFYLPTFHQSQGHTCDADMNKGEMKGDGRRDLGKIYGAWQKDKYRDLRPLKGMSTSLSFYIKKRNENSLRCIVPLISRQRQMSLKMSSVHRV